VRDTDFFRELLGLKMPWKVDLVSLTSKEKEGDVWLEHRGRAEFACPECRLALPIYDHVPARRWRHLDHGGCRKKGVRNLFRVNKWCIVRFSAIRSRHHGIQSTIRVTIHAGTC
jgi:hypothetical protein